MSTDAHEHPPLFPEERPDSLPSRTTRVSVYRHGEVQSLFVTIGTRDGRPSEVFTTIAKNGTDDHADAEMAGRLCSLWLRAGGDAWELVRQLRGITNGTRLFGPGENAESIGDAIALVLSGYVERKGTDDV